MFINVSDPQTQTLVVTIILSLVAILSIRHEQTPAFLTTQHGSELKGLAILMVIFGHIGYLLSRDHSFLSPLSGSAGVGVDIFLILSGFGLAVSALKKELSPLEFYKKRFVKIFIPMWAVIALLLILDHFVHGLNYSGTTILQSFLGFFPDSNPFGALDSPLWYFTLITFYYLLFPLVFVKRLKYLSPIIFIVVGYLMLNLPLPIDTGIWTLYSLHYWGFSVGIIVALLLSRLPKNLTIPGVVRLAASLLGVLFIIYNYFSPHVGSSRELEQLYSIITALAYIVFISLKGFRVQLLKVLGDLSYEIYLVHWPILFRYDLIYTALPAGIATMVYLAIFTIIGWAIQRTVAAIPVEPPHGAALQNLPHRR